MAKQGRDDKYAAPLHALFHVYVYVYLCCHPYIVPYLMLFCYP